MRCSICFAEMKQGPNGLECGACDTQLQPVEEESDGTAASTTSLSQQQKIGLAALIVAGTIAVAFAVYLRTTSQAPETGDLANNLFTPNVKSYIVGDTNEIVARALPLSKTSSIEELVLEKGCQRVSAEVVDAIQWLNVDGQPLALVRPAFPGNWRLHTACPQGARGAIFTTVLDDGVAVSNVGQRGELIWSRLTTVANPRPETVGTMLANDMVYLLAHDSKIGGVEIVSFDENGNDVWRQLISSGSLIERAHIAGTRLGDLLIAWREPGLGLRLIIVSDTGLILQDRQIAGRFLPLNDIAQDEVGQTYLLFGSDEIRFEVLTASGDPKWQHSIATSGTPLGIIGYDDRNYLFGIIDARLIIWGLDPRGNLVGPLELDLNTSFRSGEVQRINGAEAMITLSSDEENVLELVLDLRRLSNALEFSEVEIGSEGRMRSMQLQDLQVSLKEPDIVESEPNETETAVSIEAAPEEVAAPIASGDENPVAAILPDQSLDEDLDVPVSKSEEAQENVVAPEDFGELSIDSTQDPELELPAKVELKARCTFSCVSLDDQGTEYVLMQTVDMDEGESMSDVSLRQNDAHVTLCRVSGGKPVIEFTRECRPQ